MRTKLKAAQAVISGKEAQVNLAERKEKARAKAIAAFAKKWDSAFDRAAAAKMKARAAKKKKPGRRGRPPKKR